MSEIDVVNAPLSPLGLFRAGMRDGGVAVSIRRDGRQVFPPRFTADGSVAGADHARLVRQATVFSATRVSSRDGDRLLALVDLAGGGRLLARLHFDGDAAELIGRAVTLVAPSEGEDATLVFAVDTEGTAS